MSLYTTTKRASSARHHFIIAVLHWGSRPIWVRRWLP